MVPDGFNSIVCQFIFFISKQSPVSRHVRPTLSADLLLALATAGAFWEHGHPFFVGAEDEALDFLLSQGLASSLILSVGNAKQFSDS